MAIVGGCINDKYEMYLFRRFKYYNLCIESFGAVRIVPAMDKWIALVRARMCELKITQEKLGERIGVTQGAVGHWLRNERRPKLETMNQILVVLGLPPMEFALVTELAESSGSYGDDQNSATDAEGRIPQHNLYFRYPVTHWENLGAQDPEARFEATDYYAQGSAFWLEVQGDAMTAPVGLSVPAGMLILVDAGLSALPGKLVIARLPTSTTPVFRQLIEEGGQRYLRPLNPTYPKVVCDDACEMIGVVVQATMKF